MRTFYLAIIAILFAASGFAQTQTVSFTTAGTDTWTVPCGVTSITVEVWGGGGEGGSRVSASNGGSGGGGGGGYSRKVINVSPFATYSLRVGTANATNTNGDSWFGSNSTVLAYHGISANDNATAGGAGGALGIGDVRFAGGNGANGVNGSYGGGGGSSAGPGGAGVAATNANGANAPTGGGDGGNGRSGTQGIGVDGNTPGAGGGGALRTSSGNRAGGSGATGRVVITYIGMPDNYCIPSYGNVESITNVTFAGINNNSAYSSEEIQVFCATGNVNLGGTYPISVKGNTVGNYTDWITVFIDFNQNGVLENTAAERFTIGSITNSTGFDAIAATGNITVPANAALGYTKMRVIKNYVNFGSGYVTNPCGNFNYGQAEDYVLLVEGGCQQPTSVTANGTASTITICTGTQVVLKKVGGQLGAGQNWKWYSGSCGGTLLNTNTDNEAAFTVTPAVGTTRYYLRAEGGTCGTTGLCQSVEVVVKDAATIVLNTGVKDFQICRSAASATYVSYTLGGGATNATVTGLPTGLSGSLSGSVFSISGTTTVTAGSYPYTVTPTGNAPCTNTAINGTITVITTPTGITYTTPVTYCVGSAITSNVPVITGGTPTLYAISPAIPAGMDFNTSTGVISGTPSGTQGQITYNVTASNDCGFATGQVKITINNGSTPFNVLPSGNQNVCSSFGGITITLSGSLVATKYQLFRNGTPVGAQVDGTGNAISFGNQTLAGTYTVRTANGCIGNMNGSTTINITPQPTTQFSYAAYSYCKDGATSAANFTGSPTTGGTFSATPAGLVFSDNTTGVIDLAASSAGIYTVTYSIPASGGCGLYTYTQANKINISNAPTVYSVTGGGAFCSGGAGVAVGLSNSQSSISYRLYLNGNPIGSNVPGTGAALNFGAQTVAGTYTVKATVGSCTLDMDDEAVITVNMPPAAIAISPSTSSICQGTILPLTASTAPPSVSNASVVVSSLAASVEVPNLDPYGASKLIKVTGIPAGATITNVAVKFNIAQEKGAQLRINLKGPNGNVLNLANELGYATTFTGNGNFTNTNISSAVSNNIAQNPTAAPFTGTYAPQAEIGVDGATSVLLNKSNVSSLSALYNSAATANGNWILSVRDIKDYFFGNGTADINTWTITIDYTTLSGAQSVTWSPVTDLYTDAGATIAYVANTPATSVYVKPSGGNLNYTATAASAFGCTTTATAAVTVKTSPVLTVAANYCSPPAPVGKIRVSATSGSTVDAATWVWSNGMTGTNNTTTSYIDVDVAANYYVSVSGANGCQSTKNIKVATELIENGDFEQGNIGFVSGYTYVDNTTANGLQPAGTYTVNNAPNFNHNDFWGVDHTYGTGDGNFMLVNGTATSAVWKQTVTVIPGNTYYFAAYAVALNDAGSNANLQFRVNGVQVGLTTGALSDKDPNNNPGTWKRFYGNWTPAAGVTSAQIEIIDLTTAANGNDFGLDDISFGTLSTFLNLSSAVNTDNQLTSCINTAITPIVYEIGSDGAFPTLAGFPAGLVKTWDGRFLTISGTPTQTGTFNYSVKSTGCNIKEKTGKLIVNAASSAGSLPALVSACYNNAGTITVTGPIVGNIVNWQSSVDGTSWTNISNTTNTLSYPALTEATLYRVSAQNTTGCKIDTSNFVKVGIRNLWTGKTNAAWNTASNWSDEAIPTTSCPSVIIPVVASNIYPSITSGTTDVVNIDVKNGASLIINGGILRVSGTIASNAGIDAKEGTIVLNGTSTQSIAGANLKDKTVKNLTIENNVLLTPSATDTLKISGTLGFGAASSKTFAAGTNNVVLLSSLTRTANVANIGNNTISGNKFTVERYINTGTPTIANPLAHGRTWQLLSVPTNTTQKVRDAWMENGSTLPGYGTILNGPTAQGGYDNNSAGTYIKSYLPVQDQWSLGSNPANTNIATNRGWMVFVMGDRTSTSTLSKSTVLRTTGSLITGTQPPLSVTDKKYEVIGNPYASEIDLRKLIKPSNNLTDEVYVWDPALGAGFGFGRYRTLTLEDGEYQTVPASNNYPEFSNMIQSGQAFFVKSNGQGPSSVTFTEAVKTNNNHVVTRGAAPTTEKLRIELSVSQAGTATLLDGAIAFFKNEYSIGIDEKDGAKLINSGENTGFKTAGKLLSVDRRPSPVSADTLFVEMTGMKAQSYSWQVTTANMNKPGRNAWLLDNFLGTKTSLSLDGITTVSFDVTAVAASAAANRFSIVFNKIAAPLPVTFTGISANRNADRSIAVKWSVENEINLDKYAVERSADGVNFTGIITADVTNSRNYGKNDLSPLAQDNYYRIKATSINGQIQYSAIVKVAPIAVPASISVYPNPVEDKTMNISFVNQVAGTYQLQLINDLGQVMYNGSIKINGNNDRRQVNLQTIKAAGRYTLKVLAEDGTANSIKLLVQ